MEAGTALEDEGESVPAAAVGRSAAVAVGALIGVAGVGAGLGTGSLGLLDLAVGRSLQVPPGVWGLGPELPRRGLFWLPLTFISHWVPGPTIVSFAVIAAVTAASLGVWHRLRENGPPRAGVIVSLAAGALYSGGPWITTRLGVGHLGLVFAAAMLPWSLPSLAGSTADRRALYRWSLAFACVGPSGALIGLLVALAGWCTRQGDRGRALGAIVLPHLLWFVPGVVVSSQTSVSVTASSAFPTHVTGLPSALGLLVGSGFWADREQLGPGSTGMAVAGLLLLGLVGLGWRTRSCVLPRAFDGAAVMAATIVVMSAVPGLRDGFDWVTATDLGGPFREGQRFAIIPVLWIVLVAARGVAVVQRSLAAFGRLVVDVVTVALVVLLVASTASGLRDRWRDAGWEDDWTQAQHVVDAAPGTVAALPLSQYVDLPSDGRRVLNPAAQLLDADVLESTDPGFDVGLVDDADPRVAPLTAALTQLGSPVLADEVATLGVRWLAVVPGVDRPLEQALRSRPGFTVRLDLPSLLLVEDRRWIGDAVTADGSPVSVRQPLSPLASMGARMRLEWFHPAAPGWLRGRESAVESERGTLLLPPGDGVVWFWPAVVVVPIEVAVVAGAVRRRSSRTRRSARSGDIRHY